MTSCVVYFTWKMAKPRLFFSLLKNFFTVTFVPEKWQLEFAQNFSIFSWAKIGFSVFLSMKEKKKDKSNNYLCQFWWKRTFLVLENFSFWDTQKCFFQKLLRKFSWNCCKTDSSFKILLFSSLKQNALSKNGLKTIY